MTDVTSANRIATRGAAAGPGVADYFALLKPRVMSLVVFTGFVGLYLAPGHLHPLLAAVAVLCIAVGAGASGAINMWYDRDIDAVMRRTQARPLPAGRMEPGEALGFGCFLAGASVIVMGLAVNWAAAADRDRRRVLERDDGAVRTRAQLRRAVRRARGRGRR